VREHAAHRAADYGQLVGRFLTTDAELPHLAGVLDGLDGLDGLDDRPLGQEGRAPEEPALLTVTVVVAGGAGAVAPAVHWATRTSRLRLGGLQVAIRESDAGDLAPNAGRILAAVDHLLDSGLLDEDVPVHLEPPPLSGEAPSASWLEALDEVAARDHRLTFRTLDAAGEPVLAGELATCIEAALDRELAFSCGPGLSRALRHRDDTTGRRGHGFLNVLLATRASLDGAGADDVTAVLEESDPATVTEALDLAGPAPRRRWFASALAGSIPDAVRDLTELGLLGPP
jgi:hypothetical protein